MTLRLTGKHQDIFSTCYMSTQLSLYSLYTSKPSNQLGLSDRLVLDYIFVQQESVSSIFINIQPVFSMILRVSPTVIDLFLCSGLCYLLWPCLFQNLCNKWALDERGRRIKTMRPSTEAGGTRSGSLSAVHYTTIQIRYICSLKFVDLWLLLCPGCAPKG